MKYTRLMSGAAVAAACLGVAACSGPAATESANDPGELTVWVMGDSSTNFETLIAPYVAETGVEVEVVAVPWDAVDQKFTTAVASGDGPDLLQIGLSKVRTYADSGALLGITDDIVADYPGLAPANFVGDPMQVGGETVAVPWISDTRVLFYRSDILEENGIDAPPTTWEELREDAAVLAARGDGQYGYYIPQWDSPLPVIMTRSFGGDIIDADGNVDFDTPEFRQAVDLYTGLYEDGSVPTNSDFDQTQGFVSGIAPMLVSGPYLAGAISSAAPELDGSWGVTTIPSGTANSSLLAGSSMGVWGDSDNLDGALGLLEYLSSPEAQVSWYTIDGQLPTNVDALADPTLTNDPLVSVYSVQLETSRALPLVPNWDGETGSALLNALNSIVLTGTDEDEALNDLFNETAGTSVN